MAYTGGAFLAAQKFNDPALLWSAVLATWQPPFAMLPCTVEFLLLRNSELPHVGKSAGHAAVLRPLFQGGPYGNVFFSLRTALRTALRPEGQPTVGPGAKKSKAHFSTLWVDGQRSEDAQNNFCPLNLTIVFP